MEAGMEVTPEAPREQGVSADGRAGFLAFCLFLFSSLPFLFCHVSGRSKGSVPPRRSPAALSQGEVRWRMFWGRSTRVGKSLVTS